MTNMTNHIPLILTAALSALTILACAGPPEPSTPVPIPTPQPATPTPSPVPTQVSPDPDPLAALQPAAVCKVLTRQNLEPYERLLAPTGNADELMEIGWPHRGRPPFRLEPPIDWEHLASVDRSWNYQLNAWSPVHSILTEHTRSSQPRYLSFALAFAADWIDKNPYSSAETDSDVEDFGWYDMAVGLRVYQIAYMLDAACRDSSVPAARIRQLWESLLDHFDYLSDDDNIVFHTNHGLYQASGQFAAATRLSDFAPISSFRLQAVSRLERIIDRQFSAEGVHLEHSPGYQHFVAQLIAGIAPLGLLTEFPSLADRMERYEDALAWMILPNRRLANLGDTDYRDLTKENVVVTQSTLLDYAISGGLRGIATSQRIRVFPESGLAVLRSGWPDAESFDRASYLAQQAGFHSRTHKQADDLSFIWYDRGTEILIDAGRYGYLGKTERGSDLWNEGFWYSDPKRIYVESTRSHNTVEIDGMSFNRKDSPPYGSAIERWGETEDGLLFVETHATQFETISHARLLVLDPGNWLLVYDWLSDEAEEKHDYRQWFHFAPDLTVEPQNGGLRVSGEPLDTNLAVVSLLPDPVSSEPVFGQQNPDLLGWWSEKGGAFEPTTSANFSVRQANSAAFATLFSFSNAATPDLDYQKIEDSGRTAKLKWTTPKATHTLSIAMPTEGDIAIDHRTEPEP